MVQRVRLPVQGGNVKIVSSPAALSGTTIAGFEGQSLTISQLAVQIATALGLSTQAAKSPGSSGSAAAAIVLGPGLTGGGPVVGAVPINLNASIPWNMQDDPPEAEWLPVPGQPGARGAQGSNGPGVYLMDDPPEADWLPVPGQPGATGATGPQGPAGSGTAAAAGMWIPEDAPEADWMPVPGAQGARGLPGIAAAVGCWIPEDATDDPLIVGYGPQITVVTGANPTAKVGPTATNGSATTFMRSDGAPAIDLTASYSWTGIHSFAGTNGTGPALMTGIQLLGGNNANFVQGNIAAPVDNRLWDSYIDSTAGALVYRVLNDAKTANTAWLSIARSGVNLTSLLIGGGASIGLQGPTTIGSVGSGVTALTINASTASTGLQINGGASTQASLTLTDGNTGNHLWQIGNGSPNPGYLYMYDGTAGNYRFQISTSGLLRLYAYGAGTLTTDASGNVSATSDRRIKRKVRPFRKGLDAIAGLEPVLHGYTKKSGLDQSRNNYAGFIAQNVRDHIPEAVGEMLDGMLSLSDRPIIAALVNAVNQLAEQVAELKQQLASK